MSSTTTNCSGFSRLPAFIWVVAKPPIETARSSDHFTSAAVTLRPPWKRASARILNVMLVPSLASCQLSASSGFHLVVVEAGGDLVDLHPLEADQPVVAVQRHAVDRLGRPDPLHVQAVGAVFLHQQQGLVPGWRRLRRGFADAGRRKGRQGRPARPSGSRGDPWSLRPGGLRCTGRTAMPMPAAGRL